MYQKGQVLVWVAVGVMVLVILATFYYASRQAFLKYTSQNPVVTPQPTPLPTPDETANWRIYTNTEYKFSIKYPDFVTYKEKVFNDVTFYYKIDEENIPKNKYDLPNYYTKGLGILFRTGLPEQAASSELPNRPQEKVQINNSTGVKISDSIFDYYLSSKEEVNSIRLVYLGLYETEDEKKDRLQIYQQMLSTFKFTESGGIETVELQEGYGFDVTLPSGYQYKKERVGDIVGYIADQNGEKFIRFYISSAGGERSPKGKTTIDSVPFTIDLRSNIGCNADLSATNAKYPGPDKLYFQMMPISCKDDKEWLSDNPPVNKDMEQIIQSIKFNSKLKELLSGKTAAPLVQK